MLKGHGGNIYAAAKRIGCKPEEIIDMSSNLNPLGPPPGLIEHLKGNIDSICSLPEVDSKEISILLSKKYDIPEEFVLAGNGTTQFIYSIPKALASAKALIVGPTYSDYEDACIMNHVDYSYFYTEETDNFSINFKKLFLTVGRYDTVFICNPNNPTGALIPLEELEKLCKAFPETYFVIDESYLPFVVDSYKASAISLKLSNVIVLNSMSKVFRIPGLRVGFLLAPVPIIYKFSELTLPWSVNAIAQAAVKIILENDAISEFLEQTRRFVEEEKNLFVERFKGNSNIKLFPGSVYYVIAKLADSIKAKDVCRKLEEDKVLIRDCANFTGLPENYIRFSLKTRDVNMALADKVCKILQLAI